MSNSSNININQVSKAPVAPEKKKRTPLPSSPIKRQDTEVRNDVESRLDDGDGQSTNTPASILFPPPYNPSAVSTPTPRREPRADSQGLFVPTPVTASAREVNNQTQGVPVQRQYVPIQPRVAPVQPQVAPVTTPSFRNVPVPSTELPTQEFNNMRMNSMQPAHAPAGYDPEDLAIEDDAEQNVRSFQIDNAVRHINQVPRLSSYTSIYPPGTPVRTASTRGTQRFSPRGVARAPGVQVQPRAQVQLRAPVQRQPPVQPQALVQRPLERCMFCTAWFAELRDLVDHQRMCPHSPQ